MNYKMTLRNMNFFCIVGIFSLLSFSCEELLPVYTFPTNVLAININTIEQLNDHQAPPGAQSVRIILTGENIFDEVFLDSVDIKGTMRIWWKRKPGRYRTIYLTAKDFKDKNLIHNGKLMLVPGQKFSLETYWNLRTDDSLYLASTTEMDFSYARRRICGPNIICANPETFVVEAALNVFDRIGIVPAAPKEFIFVARSYNNP